MIDHQNISVRLEKLKEYGSYLKSYQKNSLTQIKKDYTLQGAICRYFQLSVECVIDIAELLISSLGFRKPATGFEAIEILGENNIIPPQFSKKFAPIVGFRNILVHDYTSIDLDKVYQHLKEDLKDFNLFAKLISNFLKNK
ncbi:MAG: type VII toxin-antitoxin system HepT family RNase toxin [Elusimicrobiota bacterium]